MPHELRLFGHFWLTSMIVMSITSNMSSAVEQSRPIKIVAFGDSTTVGYSVVENFPRQLSRRLEQQGISAKVINSGVNGDTTSGAAERFEPDVLAHLPDIVIIQFGLNDQTMRLYEDPHGMKSYVSRDQYAKNLRRFVAELRELDCHVILMTPNPMCWTETLERHYPNGPYIDPPNGGNRLLEEYAKAVREIARTENIPLVDVFDYFGEYEERSGQKIQQLFLDDGVHPNEHGYQLIVEQLIPELVAILKPAQIGKRIKAINSESR